MTLDRNRARTAALDTIATLTRAWRLATHRHDCDQPLHPTIRRYPGILTLACQCKCGARWETTWRVNRATPPQRPTRPGWHRQTTVRIPSPHTSAQEVDA